MRRFSLFVAVDVLISKVWWFTCTLCNQPNGDSGFLLIGSGDDALTVSPIVSGFLMISRGGPCALGLDWMLSVRLAILLLEAFRLLQLSVCLGSVWDAIWLVVTWLIHMVP